MSHRPAVADVCDVCGGRLVARADDTAEAVRARLRDYHEDPAGAGAVPGQGGRARGRRQPARGRGPGRDPRASASPEGGPAPGGAPPPGRHPPRRARLGLPAGRGAAGVGELAVRYRYDRPPTPPGVPGNVLDLGVLDAAGRPGFRGGRAGPAGRLRDQRVGATRATCRGRSTPAPGRSCSAPTPSPPGAGLGGRGVAGRRAAGAGLRPRPGARAGGRPGPRLVPGRPAHPHRPLRRPPHPGRAGRRGPRGRARLRRLHRAQHHQRQPRLGHAGPDLVVDGQEVTTRDGTGWPSAWPWRRRSIDWRYRAADGVLDRVVAGLRAAGGLAVAAHPFCPFPGCAWRFGYEGVDAVEVWNGPWTPDDEAALAAWDRLLAARAAPAASCRRWPAATPTRPTGRPPPHRRPGRRAGPAVAAVGLAAGRCWMAASAGRPGAGGGAAGRVAGIGGRLDVPPGQEVTVRLRVGARRRPGPAPHRRRDGAGGPPGRRRRDGRVDDHRGRHRLGPGRGPPGGGHGGAHQPRAARAGRG